MLTDKETCRLDELGSVLDMDFEKIYGKCREAIENDTSKSWPVKADTIEKLDKIFKQISKIKIEVN